MSDYPSPPPPAPPNPPAPHSSQPSSGPPSYAPPQGPPSRVPAGHSGLSIAAFVLSLVGGGPLAFGLGIAGLLQARKRQEKRGLAIAALVISGLGMLIGAVAIVVIIIAANAEQADRDSAGVVTTPGTVQATTVKPGDCINGLKESSSITSVNVVPCTEAHEAEAVGQKVMTGATFPGDAEIVKAANDACPGLVETYAGDKAESVEVMFLHPTEQSWNLRRDRTIICIATHPSPQTGSLKG